MAFGFTYTLPTISGSHTDFVAILKTVDFPSAAIDGTTDAIDNGGGNLRAYTDDTKVTQLSVDIVTFVSSGSPDAIVWIKVPTAATGNTIFIEADVAASAQPAVGAAFGRNSVYPNYVVAGHLNESPSSSSGHYINSAGNSDGTAENSAQTNITGPFGATTLNLNGTDEVVEFPISISGTEVTVSLWGKATNFSTDQRLMYLYDSTGTGSGEKIVGSRWLDIGGTDIGWASQARNTLFVASTLGVDDDSATTDWQYITLYMSDALHAIYVDGVLTDSAVTTGTANTEAADTLQVGRAIDLTGASNHFLGGASHVTLFSGDRRSHLATEYDNQVASSAWGTVGAWEGITEELTPTAVGTASLTTVVTTTVTPSATATGTSTLATAVTLVQTFAATAVGTLSTVADFIAGVAGAIVNKVHRIAIRLGLGG